jgi:hypothetical protein
MSMPRYPVRFDDLPDLPSQPISKAARKANESNELTVYRYGLGAGARGQMYQYDVEAAHDGADAAMKASLRLLRNGLGEAGGSPTGGEIVGQWLAELQNANQKTYRRRFGV